MRLIDDLPEPLRSLVVLFDVQRMSGAECAAILGISVNEMKVYLQHQQMLNFLMSATLASSEAEAAELLSGIEGIRVRVYEDLEDSQAVVEFVDDTSGQLEHDGWQRTVFIQDGDERVRMYIRFDEDRVAGMTVMVVDDSEAAFINVAGVIDPTTLGQLVRQMGIDGVRLEPLGRARPGRAGPLPRSVRGHEARGEVAGGRCPG